MEDRELDRALARAMGAEAHEWYQTGSVSPFYVSGHCVNFGPHQCYPNEASPQVLQDRIPPAFSISIDALQTVEGRLRADGWVGPDMQWSGTADPQPPATATWWHFAHGYFGATARIEARARAEAALQAMTSITTLASREG